jgi:hypothetical protein
MRRQAMKSLGASHAWSDNEILGGIGVLGQVQVIVELHESRSAALGCTGLCPRRRNDLGCGTPESLALQRMVCAIQDRHCSIAEAALPSAFEGCRGEGFAADALHVSLAEI